MLSRSLLLASDDPSPRSPRRLEARGFAPAPGDVKRALDYLHTHYAEPVALEDLVAVSRVPGRTLNEHFRAFTGLSPLAYLKRHRLQRARGWLATGCASTVTEAAIRGGFQHLGRFSRDYKEAFGERPSETLVQARRAAAALAERAVA